MIKNYTKTQKYFLIIGILIIIITRLINFNSTILTDGAIQTLSILIAIIPMWLFVDQIIPSIIGIIGLLFVENLKTKSVLLSSFFSPTFIFLWLTFLCSSIISETSYIKKLAITIVTQKFAVKSQMRFSIFWLLSVSFLGLFMSPTVLFILLLPLMDEIIKVLEIKKTSVLGKQMMMSLLYGISISCAMTPIGHVFSTLALGFAKNLLNLQITQLQYMSFGIPVGIVLILFLILMYKIFFPLEETKLISNDQINKLKSLIPEKRKKEKLILLTWIIMIFIWVILPILIKSFKLVKINPLFGTIAKNSLVIAPLVGIILLFIIDIKSPIKNIKKYTKTTIKSKAPLLMTACALALAGALSSNDTNIKVSLTNIMGKLLINMPNILFVLTVALWAAIQTNFSSNIVTISLVSSITLSIITSTNVNPVVMSMIIGFLGSCAFATPSAHPNVSIAGGSGYISPRTILIIGFVLIIFAVLIITFIAYPIYNNIF